jgi:hypothetical protein
MGAIAAVPELVPPAVAVVLVVVDAEEADVSIAT